MGIVNIINIIINSEERPHAVFRFMVKHNVKRFTRQMRKEALEYLENEIQEYTKENIEAVSIFEDTAHYTEEQQYKALKLTQKNDILIYKLRALAFEIEYWDSTENMRNQHRALAVTMQRTLL